MRRYFCWSNMIDKLHFQDEQEKGKEKEMFLTLILGFTGLGERMIKRRRRMIIMMVSVMKLIETS